jgi:hypothetical protein
VILGRRDHTPTGHPDAPPAVGSLDARALVFFNAVYLITDPILTTCLTAEFTRP